MAEAASACETDGVHRLTLRALFGLCLGAAACTTTPPVVPIATAPAPIPAPAPTPADDGLLAFDAVVQIDPAPSGKNLQAVWLERGDGARFIAAYRPEAWLRPFDGARVSVTGRTWSPEGQAVRATHLRIETLRRIDAPEDAELVAVGPERTLPGRFVQSVGEPGTKGEGESYVTFAPTIGGSYLLANQPAALRFDVEVEITAREAELSRFAARRGGPTLWVLGIDGHAADEPPRAETVSIEPYARASGDLDGDGVVETITLGHDGALTVAGSGPATSTRVDWIHPTDDYWGGLERDQRLTVVRLDAKTQAVVFWQFQEGDVDPDRRYHFFGYWDGAIHPLTPAPLDVAHATDLAVVGGKITFIEESCLRDATIRADGSTAADGLSRRDVRSLRWRARKGLTPSLRRTDTRSRCLVAACPFVDVGPARIGEILRRMSEPRLEGSQSLRLPPFAGGRLVVTLAEDKQEVTSLDDVRLWADGVEHQPLECAAGHAACGDDGVAHRLGPGDRAAFTFSLPAADDVVLVVDGHYVPR